MSNRQTVRFHAQTRIKTVFWLNFHGNADNRGYNVIQCHTQRQHRNFTICSIAITIGKIINSPIKKKRKYERKEKKDIKKSIRFA